MLHKLFFVIWFFLPAALANTAPVVVSKVPFLKKFTQPVDFGKSWRGKRIFGDHKTIRGFVAGILTGIGIALLQLHFYNASADLRDLIPIDYNELNVALFGGISAFGALLGDSVKSFFKRRSGVKPGQSWFPFDQVDYIFGGVLATMLFLRLEYVDYLLLFVVYFILHPLSTVTGYLLKLKDSPI